MSKVIQIAKTNHPVLNQHNGMFLTVIAGKRRMGEFDDFIDFAKRSEGESRGLNHWGSVYLRQEDSGGREGRVLAAPRHGALISVRFLGTMVFVAGFSLIVSGKN